MDTIVIQIDREIRLALEEKAKQLNIDSVGDLLVKIANSIQPSVNKDFDIIMRTVLEKNKELYRRLA